MYKQLILLAFILFANRNTAYTQIDTLARKDWVKHNIAFAYSFHRGKVLKNYDPDFPVKNSQYHEIAVLWQMDGRKSWHEPFCYPLSGLALNYARFGNDTILGSAIGLMPQWVIQARKGKKLQINFRLGVGLAYFTEYYDRVDVPENEVVSSTVTNITSFGGALSYHIFPTLSVFAGVSIFHYSNGHTSIPNMGINDRPYSFGLLYTPRPAKLVSVPQKFDYDKKLHLNFRIGRGVHEMAESTLPVGGPLFPVYNFALFVSKQVSRVNNLHLGMYATYYSGFYHYLMFERRKFQGEERKNSFVYSAFAGHEFLIGHFGFTQELLFNVWNPFYKEVKFKKSYEEYASSERLAIYLGLRLQFDYYPFKRADVHENNVYLGMNLKTIVSKADYVEFHVGYSL